MSMKRAGKKQSARQEPKGYKMMPGEIAVAMDKIKPCKYCGASIAFVYSEIKRRFYPVNWDNHTRTGAGNALVDKRDFHNCRSVR